MSNLKKYVALGLSFIICFSNVIISHAGEEENYITAFQVDEEDLDMKAQKYNMPEEVKDYIEKILSEDKNAEITVYSPDILSTRASSSSWSNTRSYNGYTLKDWNVHNETSTGMKDIRKGTLANKFADSLAVYCSGAFLDSVVPFGSAGLTLAQFIFGNNTTIYAGSGDKASAAVKFTSDTKFTYVNVGGNYQLGARTSKAKLENITWYFYYDKTHKENSGSKVYNKTYTSSSYNFPDAKAISGTGIGGYLESPMSIRIGDFTFVLE